LSRSVEPPRALDFLAGVSPHTRELEKRMLDHISDCVIRQRVLIYTG
jgi:hypothetical protein